MKPQVRAEASSCGELAERVRRALDEGRPNDVGDDETAELVTLAVRLYAAKAEVAEGVAPSPFPQADAVTPTEALVLISALLRACDLNLFDMAMWFQRGNDPRNGGA